MPLPNKFNMNGDTSRGNRINQRKGLNYFDDPLMFYDALRIYVDDSKNAKFVNCLYNAYKFEGYDRNYEKFLEVNKLNVMYEYFSEKNIEKYYLKSLLENNLDGIYQYMFNACEIINERHKICEQEYNNLL